MIGYLLAALIGLSLGLMGGGGSILTVPILIYVLKMDPKISIALSLAIVGFTSLFGVFNNIKNKTIEFKVVMMFAPFTIIGTLLGTKAAAHMSATTQLLIFAVVMLSSSILMIRGRKEETLDHKTNYITLSLAGVFVGVLSGVVGVGGGFLIVPTLVILANVPMKKAVGTSLVVIAVSSLSGFAGYAFQMTIPWAFLAKFVAFSSIGIVVGSSLVKYIPQQKLKKAFGVFLIIMGSMILYKNIDKINLHKKTSGTITTIRSFKLNS